MADWENVEPDEYKYLGCNYNPGRPQGIHGITIHHMAGDLDADDCNRVWRNAETSAHYSIDRNGWIVQHVDDGDVPGHAAMRMLTTPPFLLNMLTTIVTHGLYMTQQSNLALTWLPRYVRHMVLVVLSGK